MNEVTPWISDYFVGLATKYGSSYNTAPRTAKAKKCQLKKVLTSEPKDYIWVVLSDKQHEIPGRIPKEVVEECIKETKRDKTFTRHIGSIIGIRDFAPLFIRVEDGPSTSAPRKVLGLEIGKARLHGCAGETIWGSPKQLDSVPELKKWLHELRKPDGNRDILKIERRQQDEAKAAEQFNGPSEPSPHLGLQHRPATYAPAAALRKAASTTSTVGERSPIQRYRRKWHKAVPGLDEFTHCLQMPEDVRLKISKEQTNKKAGAKLRPSGTAPANRPPNTRGALEIGSSPARLSSVLRATTPEEWPASPGVLQRLYDVHESDMSSDVCSSRQSSPVNVHQDVEMHEVEVQPEPEIVPETPQATIDSQPRHPSPPPPAQPPRPRSPLPSSSNPQIQNAPTSPGSIHTSVQAVSGSQLPSFEKPPAWARSDDEPSNGPSFELPWSQRDDPLVAVSKPTPGAHPSSEKQVTKLPGPVKESALPAAAKPPQEKATMAKKILRTPAFGESIIQAIELAFQGGNPEVVVPTTDDPSMALPAPRVTVAQLPPPKPRSKPPSKGTQKSLPRPSPSPLDQLVETSYSESPLRHPLQALNRKVPIPEVGPTREPVRGINENGVPTMVLIPASDDTKLSSPLKQDTSSQPIQSSQSIPSSQPILPSKHLPSQTVPSSEHQTRHSPSRPNKSVAQDGNSVVIQVNEKVADIEKIQESTGNTQSSLEYASTQDENKVAVDTDSSKFVDRPAEVVVAKEKAADRPRESPLPQIVAIREVESQQSAALENEEEIDELDDDPEMGGHDPVTKRKSKPPSKPLSKPTKRAKPKEPAKPASSKAPSRPPSRGDSVLEKVSSRSSSKLPPKPIVLIERRRTPVAPEEKRASAAQKRRLSTPSEEGFPAPQPIKRSRVHGHRPVQTTLSPIPRTPSPLPQEDQNSVVSSVSRSAKGKERAKGIKGLEKINAPKNAEREEPKVVQAQLKKQAPDTGSKRKPSDAFSAQDDSRDIKRQKVAREPEPRKPVKQLSFVDPDKLKRPFRSGPQTRKTSAQQGTTTTAEPSAVSRPDKDGRTSKYFNPPFYREPEHPRITVTPEAELPQKVANTKPDARRKGVVHENGCDSGDLRPGVDSRKTTTSNSDRQLHGESRKTFRVLDDDEPPGRSAAATRAKRSKFGKDMERDWVVAEPQYPPVRKMGSFAPDLNPPFLPGLPGGRLMNEQLREILIRTGKVRVRQAKAAESNQNGR